MSCADSDTSVAVAMVKAPHGGPIVWANPRHIPESRSGLVELWARRLLGRGEFFDMLTTDDLRAVPGLFEVA